MQKGIKKNRTRKKKRTPEKKNLPTNLGAFSPREKRTLEKSLQEYK